MSVLEKDAFYRYFRSWGAKKYAYSYTGEDLHITVAGVPKKEGAKELKLKGGLEAFKPGFVWTDTNKLEAVYNDKNAGRYIIDGHRVVFTKNIVLRPTTYKLSLTDDYADIIEYSAELLKQCKKNCEILRL